MEYVLETQGLSKQYKNFKALDGLSMHVPKGAIYGFVGRNGAGKTTLIRLICGLQQPSEGEYILYGCSGNDKSISLSRRRIGAVVETPSIYSDMTAEDNLRQQCKIMGIPSERGISKILKMVGLENTGKKKAGDFSLGMKQRLGIAIALVGSPDFLILDEPVNGLDPQGIIDMRELILRLNRKYQITFLISSHILDELSRLATHYGFIDRGRLIKEISASQLENSCRKCMRVRVSDTGALARTLDRLSMEYKIGAVGEADIFAPISATELVMALAEEDCEVFSAEEKDESLESYFVNLVGGGSRE